MVALDNLGHRKIHRGETSYPAGSLLCAQSDLLIRSMPYLCTRWSGWALMVRLIKEVHNEVKMAAQMIEDRPKEEEAHAMLDSSGMY